MIWLRRSLLLVVLLFFAGGATWLWQSGTLARWQRARGTPPFAGRNAATLPSSSRSTSSHETDEPQGIRWVEWLKTSDSRAIDIRLKQTLERVIASWGRYGVRADAFYVLRTRSARAMRSYPAPLLNCYPFDKGHKSGRAIDISLGDLNRDGRKNLLDLCLFASSLRSLKGGCGVYVDEFSRSTSALWVHLDISGKADRWGEWRTMTNDVHPIIWTKNERPIRERCAAWGLSIARNPLRVVVDKERSAFRFEARRKAISVHPSLRVYAGKWPVGQYLVALGFDPVGDKQKRDDYRTPEGDFYTCGSNAQSQFHKAIRISYPNAEDALRGFRSHLISRATRDAILKANSLKALPPQQTALGGDIMLHGGGAARAPWTWGCIALDNDDIDELFALLPAKTPVRILPVNKTHP